MSNVKFGMSKLEETQGRFRLEVLTVMANSSGISDWLVNPELKLDRYGISVSFSDQGCNRFHPHRPRQP